MGIEPTADIVTIPATGFEVQEAHQRLLHFHTLFIARTKERFLSSEVTE